MSQNVIGIDVGSSSLKAVTISNNIRNFQILKESEEMFDLESIKSKADVAINFLKTNKTASIISGIEGGEIFRKSFELPFLEHAKILKTAPFQLDQKLPFKIDDSVFDSFYLKNKKDKTTEIFSYVVKKEYFSNEFRAWKDSNLSIKGLLPDTSAYYFISEYVGKNLLIVDFGASSTRVFLKYDGKIAIDKVIFSGGNDIDLEISERFNVPIEQAKNVKEKVSKVFDEEYPDGNEQINSISEIIKNRIDIVLQDIYFELDRLKISYDDTVFVLGGGGAKISNLKKYFASRLNLSEYTDLPIKDLSMLKAFGYSLKETIFSGDFKVNFLKGQYALSKSGESLLTPNLIKLIVFSIIIISLFFTLQIVKYRGLKQKESIYLKEAKSVSKKLFGMEFDKPEDILTTINDSLDGSGDDEYFPKTSAFDHLHNISENLLMANLKIDIRDLSISDKQIVMKARVDKLEDIDLIVLSLKKIECFQDIQKGNTKNNTRTNQLDVQLTINNVDCKKN
ncbi:hypothetical protein JXR93_05275 [bacterium]|nr:hypothetical protein [bacterium]